MAKKDQKKTTQQQWNEAVLDRFTTEGQAFKNMKMPKYVDPEKQKAKKK